MEIIWEDIKRLFRKLKLKLKRLKKENIAGIYITVIFHLTVIIVLLICQIGLMTVRDNSFVLDFSKEEEMERMEQENLFKEDISKRLDELIAAAAAAPTSEIRNIAVDASQLRDDRNTDADKLYEDARRLQDELNHGKDAVVEEDDDRVDPGGAKKSPKEEQEYKGPSVVSYSLDGRKASRLSIPAYRCLKGGDVTVIITVDPQGKVVDARIMDAISSSDPCLQNYAKRAARLSKFSKSPSAPARQRGEIVYRFIAQ